MTFEFSTARRIYFGSESDAVILTALESWGHRLLLVVGSHPVRTQDLLETLEKTGKTITIFQVPHEPTVDLVQTGVQQARSQQCEAVIALGGGSVMDAAKAIAVMLTNSGDLTDYLEVVGLGRPVRCPGVPLMAIPTTAGTGAEVTRNAVLDVPDHQRKVSMRSPFLLPTLAVVDPQRTVSMPPNLTAQTGLDALTQVIEPFVSMQANPLTDGFCREGIRRAARSLRQAVEDGGNLQARTDMALASLCGGLALANAKLGAVHGLAGPLGGLLHAPHGAICGALLPWVVEANVTALQQRQSDHSSLIRFAELGELLSGRTATPHDAVEWLHALCRDVNIPSLGRHGLTEKHIPILAEQAQTSSSMKGNPLVLTTDELQGILQAAL